MNKEDMEEVKEFQQALKKRLKPLAKNELITIIQDLSIQFSQQQQINRVLLEKTKELEEKLNVENSSSDSDLPAGE